MLGVEVTQQNYWQSSFTQNVQELYPSSHKMTWENLVGDSSIQQVLLLDRQRPQSKLIPVHNFPDHPGGHKRVHCECENKHLLHSHFYLNVKGVQSPVLWPYNQELKAQATFLRQQEYWPWYFVSKVTRFTLTMHCQHFLSCRFSAKGLPLPFFHFQSCHFRLIFIHQR